MAMSARPTFSKAHNDQAYATEAAQLRGYQKPPATDRASYQAEVLTAAALKLRPELEWPLTMPSCSQRPGCWQYANLGVVAPRGPDFCDEVRTYTLKGRLACAHTLLGKGCFCEVGHPHRAEGIGLAV